MGTINYNSGSTAQWVTRVTVEKLFGLFDHDLQPEPASFSSIERLLILYGDNGSGKTTLLWLIYHLLNKKNEEGHRTFLASARFQRLAVFLSDGTVLTAVRPLGQLVGSFVLTVSRGSETYSFKYETRSDGAIGILSNDPVHTEFATHLPTLQFRFLPHDRLSSIPTGETFWGEQRIAGEMAPREARLVQTSIVEQVLSKTLEIVRAQVIKASSAGQLSANAVYGDLIPRIAQYPGIQVEAARDLRKGLREKLTSQEGQMREFSAFGLASQLDVTNMITAIEQSKEDRLPLIAQVLTPFLEGNSARLTALGSIHVAIRTLVDNINSFYKNKRITFHLEKGINITTEDGTQLSPAVLSSGEKQLLLLFCGTVSAIGGKTIVFIDEPEISLNVVWQRSLVQVLLQCVGDVPVQFLVATHSLELLARHRTSVVRLSTAPTGSPKPPLTVESSTE